MTVAQAAATRQFPPFSLSRLLRTVFQPRRGERVAVLIDLPDPRDVQDFRYLDDPRLAIQQLAHRVFYGGLLDGVAAELGLEAVDLYAYQVTGGSNLDLPEELYDPQGVRRTFEQDVYPRYDIVLCISTFSATAPLTAAAKQHGFRGATLHGLNEIILSTGLAVDYQEVSRDAEALRRGITGADSVEIDFEVRDRRYTLTLELGGQDAQKSHGLCRGEKPDVANLPAGEVYFVPSGAEGHFPMRYDDGTIGLMTVEGGRIVRVELLDGDAATVEEHRRKLADDPVTGDIGELGFGTQELPFSGRDIQDEKVLGTVHVATGRSDHLGGHLTPDLFAERSNATHDDILFAPHKTPEIRLPQVRMHRHGGTEILIEDYQPAAYLRGLLEAVRPAAPRPA
jgi:aminopeptidase